MRAASMLILFMLNMGLAMAETYDLTRVQGQVLTRDLQNLGDAVGVKIEMFDYEIPISHCVHFSVELHVDSDPPEVIDARGECSDGGPHRLTVQWRENDGEVQLYFYLYRRDIGQGGGIGGPQFDVSGHGGWSGGGTRSQPVFKFGQRTQLTGASYYKSMKNEYTGLWEREWTKRIVVFAELRENPEVIIGTE